MDLPMKLEDDMTLTTTTRIVTVDAALKLAGTLILAILVPLSAWMLLRLLDHADRLSRIEVRQGHVETSLSEQKSLLREVATTTAAIDRKVTELAVTVRPR